MFTMIHENYNVRDLDRSLAFYREALGLHEVRRNEKPEFTIVFMADDTETFELELTWLKDRTTPYNLGDEEFHLAFRTDDMEAAHASSLFHALAASRVIPPLFHWRDALHRWYRCGCDRPRSADREIP